MNRKTRKITTAVLACVMTLALAAGSIEIIGMLESPVVTVQAITSGGGSSDSSSGGSSSSSSSSSGTTAKKTKKKAAPKKKLSVSGKTATVDSTALASGKVTVSKSNILKIKNAGGKTTYTIKKVSGGAKKYFKINKKGKLTVKKGIAPGTYTIKIKVATKGNKKCKAGSKVVKVKIVVTPPPAPAPTPTTPETPQEPTTPETPQEPATPETPAN